MTDITKCMNNHCPNAQKCWRIQAPDGLMQSYMKFGFEVNEKGVICDNYYQMRNKNEPR